MPNNRTKAFRSAIIIITTLLIFLALVLLLSGTLQANQKMFLISSQIGSSIGDIQLHVKQIPAKFSPIYDYSSASPLAILEEPLSFASLKVLVNKTLVEENPGVPPDTVAAGIRLLLPDSQSFWLICTIGEINSERTRQSVLLGEAYECTSNRLWSTINGSSGKNVSVTLSSSDFLPAYNRMLRTRHESIMPTDVFIIGLYAFSPTMLVNREGTVITANVSGLLGWSGCSITHASIDGIEVLIDGGVISAEGLNGLHDVEVTVTGTPLFIPVSKTERFAVYFG